MSDFQMADGHRMEAIGVSGNNATQSTAGSGNSKGSWAQLIASTKFHATGLLVTTGDQSSDVDSQLVDIGIGAASSEVVIIPDILVNIGHNEGFALHIPFPVAIPEGSRLSVRHQSTTNSLTMKTCGILTGHGNFGSTPFQRVVAMGVNTGDSGGQSVTPGSGSKGSWVQMAASTAHRFSKLILIWGKTTTPANRMMIDIGIGAASSEAVIVPDIFVASDSSGNDASPHVCGPFDVSIPEGSRLAVRINGSGTTAVDVALYGIG